MLRVVLASALLLWGCGDRSVETCPTAEPAIGAPCGAPMSCAYLGCAGGLSTSCTCKDGAWSCSHGDCGPVPDGGLPPDAGSTGPITVTIQNTTQGSLFVSGDKTPFQVRLPGQQTGSASVPPCGVSCSGCAAFCDNPYMCDPIPCYLEIPAGASLTLTWSGKVYELSQSCSCGTDCYASTLLSPGTTTFEVPFAVDLDASTKYEQGLCSELALGNPDAIIQWQEQGMGLSSLGSTRTFTFDYVAGQGQIDLVFD